MLNTFFFFVKKPPRTLEEDPAAQGRGRGHPGHEGRAAALCGGRWKQHGGGVLGSSGRDVGRWEMVRKKVRKKVRWEDDFISVGILKNPKVLMIFENVNKSSDQVELGEKSRSFMVIQHAKNTRLFRGGSLWLPLTGHAQFRWQLFSAAGKLPRGRCQDSWAIPTSTFQTQHDSSFNLKSPLIFFYSIT